MSSFINLWKTCITTKGIFCPVDIQPNQKSRTLIIGLHSLIAPAIENKANRELIKPIKDNEVILSL